MKNTSTLLLFLVLSSNFNAQKVDFDIRTADYINSTRLSGVNVQVFESDSLVLSTLSQSEGKAKFSLPAGKIYKLLFSKTGKVSRMMSVNTKKVPSKKKSQDPNASVLFEISLFDKLSGIDYSEIENTPVTEFYYDGSSPKFAYDEILAHKMRQKVEKIAVITKEIKPKYDRTYSFKNGLKKVELNNKWGIIDSLDNEIVPLIYDYIGYQSEEIYYLMQNNKWGFMDSTAKIILAPKYHFIGPFIDGLAPVLSGDSCFIEYYSYFTDFNISGITQWGFVDKSGKEVVPSTYDDINTSLWLDKIYLKNDSVIMSNEVNYFYEGLCTVKKDGKLAVVDPSGKELIPLSGRFEAIYPFKEGLAQVSILGNKGIIDTNGNIVIPAIYEEINEFSNGLALAAYLDINAGYTTFNGVKTKGISIILLISRLGKKYEEDLYGNSEFREGLRNVSSFDKHKWGFVDSLGNEIIDLKYDDAYYFSEGLAPVKKKGRWGFIDKTGKRVIRFKYDKAYPFFKGKADVELKGRKFTIDKNGKEVT